MSGLIIHEWFEDFGGAEKVVDAVAELDGSSAMYCLWDSRTSRPDRHVHESWMANTPLVSKKALAVPLMPSYWQSLNPKVIPDWVFISSHLFAHHSKNSKALRELKTIVYVHTPARYIWEPEVDVRGKSLLASLASPFLKSKDAKAAKTGNAIWIANSNFVSQRIRRFWDIDAEVVYPPVDVKSIMQFLNDPVLSDNEWDTIGQLPHEFVFGASRFVSYKKLEQVIAYGESIGLPVVIAGSGPLESHLRSVAQKSKVPVTFLVRPSNSLLRMALSRCQVFVYPALEDFGILPVEAMAAGVATVALAVGGTSETLVDDVSGILTDEFTHRRAKTTFERSKQLEPDAIRQRAHAFDKSIFQTQILNRLNS